MNIIKNYFLICEHAQAGEGGKISINGIYDIVYAEGFPVMHREFVLVGNFKASNLSSKKLSIVGKLYDSNGNMIINPSPTMDVELPDVEKPSFNIIIRVQDATFKDPGKYHFKLFANDNEIAETEFAVEPKR